MKSGLEQLAKDSDCSQTSAGQQTQKEMRNHLYSMAKLFRMRRMDDTKYMPIISARNSTTLLDVLLPLPPETAKKN